MPVALIVYHSFLTRLLYDWSPPALTGICICSDYFSELLILSMTPFSWFLWLRLQLNWFPGSNLPSIPSNTFFSFSSIFLSLVFCLFLFMGVETKPGARPVLAKHSTLELSHQSWHLVLGVSFNNLFVYVHHDLGVVHARQAPDLWATSFLSFLVLLDLTRSFARLPRSGLEFILRHKLEVNLWFSPFASCVACVTGTCYQSRFIIYPLESMKWKFDLLVKCLLCKHQDSIPFLVPT